MILITYTKIEHLLSEKELTKLSEVFPKFLRDELLRGSDQKKKNQKVLGKLMLKKGLEKLKKNSNLQFYSKDESKKPYIPNNPYFNISHNEDYVVCALSKETSIGIDIQKIKTIDLEVFKKILRANEYDHIKNSHNFSTKFIEYWSIKEAVLKAQGKGISVIPTIMKDIDVNFKECIAKMDNKKYYFKSIQIDDDYKCYVSSLKELYNNQIELQYINL